MLITDGSKLAFVNERNANAKPDAATVTFVHATVLAEHSQQNDLDCAIQMGHNETPGGGVAERYLIKYLSAGKILSVALKTRGLFHHSQGQKDGAGAAGCQHVLTPNST